MLSCSLTWVTSTRAGPDEDVDYDEEGNEIRIDVPQNQRNTYDSMANVGEYNEDYLQNLAEQ